MCVVDPEAVISWEVTGVTPPLATAIVRGSTVRSFTFPAVMGQAILMVNDPSGMDVMNQTCFICRADYPSGVTARSDPTCVNVASKWNMIIVFILIWQLLKTLSDTHDMYVGNMVNVQALFYWFGKVNAA